MNLKQIVRWATIVSLFIIPFLPLLVANSFFFPFITGKNFAFRILVEIAFIGWAMLALVDKKYRPKFSWTFILFSAFVLWMAIADAFAVNPAKAFWSNFERMDGWVTLIHVYLLFVVTTAFLPVEKLWRKWWGTFLIGAALVCVSCALQLFHVIPIDQGGVRLDGRFGNAEYLAAYLLFGIAIAIWLYFETKQRFLKILLAILAVVEVLMLLFSETRGAIIGAIGAVFLGAVLWAIESGSRGRKFAIGAIVLLLVLAGAFFGLRSSAFVQHIPGIDRVASISLTDSETTARFKIWGMAYEGFLARPVFGWGQEGFNYVFNQYYNPSLYSQEQWFDRAHDLYLDWLIAGGLPALLLFLALIGATVVALYRAPVSRSERILLLSALAAYLFQGLFVFDNLFTYVPLAVIIAMAAASSSRPFAKLEGMKEVSDNSFKTVLLPIGIVVLGLIIWFVNVPSMRAATDLIGAITPSGDPNTNIAAFKKTYADGSFGYQEITEQLMSYAEQVIQDQTISNADKVTVFTYAVDQSKNLVAMIPGDARIHLEFAVLYRSAGDYQDALAQIQLAEKESPTKQSIIQEEGLEQWQTGNIPAAQAAFTKAYQLDTTDTDAATAAAAGYIIGGDTASAKKLLQQTFGTTTVDSDLLVVAYFQQKDFADLLTTLQYRVANSNGDVTAEFQLAEAYADAGQLTQARALIAKITAEHPEAASEAQQVLAQINGAKAQ